MAIGVTQLGNVITFTESGRELFKLDLRDSSLDIVTAGGLRVGGTALASPAELNALDGVTAGTVSPSKAIVVGENSEFEVSATYADAGSHQLVAADLELGADAGTSESGDTDFLAAGMFNVLGAALTKTKNYIAGVIGAYSITSTNASVLPKAAVLGIVMDGSTTPDGIVVGHIDGSDPSSATRANAVFKATMANAHASSGVDYGLDLHAPAIDIGSETEVAMPVAKADLRLSGETCLLQGAGAPSDGTEGTGAGFADEGSLYIRASGADSNVFINRGTKASPTWVALISV